MKYQLNTSAIHKKHKQTKKDLKQKRRKHQAMTYYSIKKHKKMNVSLMRTKNLEPIFLKRNYLKCHPL